jgi:hypothetical protein
MKTATREKKVKELGRSEKPKDETKADERRAVKTVR